MKCLIRAAVMAAALLALGAAFSATAGAEVIVSMGDSYSSGEGARAYDSETDSTSRGNDCHRTPRAWPRLLGVQMGYHLACSGATYENLHHAQKPHKSPDDQSQLKRLDDIAANVRIDTVLVTMGGNDIGFGRHIAACVNPTTSCLKNYPAFEQDLAHLSERSTSELRTIKQHAGAKRVVLVGYPDIFPAANQPKCNFLSDEENQLVHLAQADLDRTLAVAAANAGVTYISTREALAGHELCTQDSWMVKIEKARAFSKHFGRTRASRFQEMAHPNSTGQSKLAEFIGQRLRAPDASCTASNNVEFVIDDSGSMTDSDPLNIRSRAVELFLSKPLSESRTIGAIEFGSDAGDLFGPVAVSANRATITGALSALQNDGYYDGDGTDYNDAFTAASDSFPAAGARVFLTDGAHNEGSFDDGHRGGPPTYVIGLGIGPAGRGSPDADTLARIADETNGAYYPLKRSNGDTPEAQIARLQGVINELDARVNCENVPRLEETRLTLRRNPSRWFRVPFAGAAALEIVSSWNYPGVDVDFSSLQVRNATGRIIADGAGRKRIKGSNRRRAKLTLNIFEGASFDTMTLPRPRKGRWLWFRVRAPKGTDGLPVTVQSRPVDSAVMPGGSTSPGGAVTTPPAPPPPPPPPPPKPSAWNLNVVVYGGGHVGVSFNVGWQAGRDPVTCHFFRDGVEVFTAQCGTTSSKQFYGVPPGTHSFYATVSDKYGVYSDPTNTVTKNTT